jgi:flagellar hook-basal body complex protein FliE
MALIPPVGVNTAITRPVAPQATTATDPTAAARGSSFGDSVGKALDDMQASQSKADSLARDAATGRLKNIEDYLIAASDAQLSTQLTVAVRNKAVESFNEIMRMQI